MTRVVKNQANPKSKESRQKNKNKISRRKMLRKNKMKVHKGMEMNHYHQDL